MMPHHDTVPTKSSYSMQQNATISIVFSTSSPYFAVQSGGVANHMLINQYPNNSKQHSQYQQLNIVYKQEGILAFSLGPNPF